MTFHNKKIVTLLAAVIFSAGIGICSREVCAAERVQPVDGEVVIVIDPGHGGTNQGTSSGHTIEKQMTMVTAQAMYDELVKYDNVKVYLTHTDDKDYSLKERAEFAQSVGADFLFSIHYNASENHSMFGSEVWVSCETPYNAYGYQFGYLHLESMREKGLFIRGVKNRFDDKNQNDYYGVIREAAALSVPAVIIEHCYVDEERDAEYIEDENDWAEFGRADALSVAKYFGLKSTLLGVDYSEYASKLQPASADSVVQYTLQDRTAPDVCEISLLECDYDTGELSLTVQAADYDKTLIYYNYSLDNGQTWSRLESWPGSNALTGEYTDTFRLNLTVPERTRPGIIVRAYNMADVYTSSNTLTFDQTFSKREDTETGEPQSASKDVEMPATQPVEHPRSSVGTTTFMPAAGEAQEQEEGVGLLTFLKFCLALVIFLFFVVLTTQIVNYQRKKKRRQRR